MSEIKLVFPTKENEIAAMEYRQEYKEYGENRMSGDSYLNETKKYEEWLEMINRATNTKIRSFIFFAYRKLDNKMIGTINLRFPYEDWVCVHGHIGYGVRPSERRKGYAIKMLSLTLNECKNYGLDKVLITCDKSNIASSSTIIKNGGILEKEEIDINGNIKQRYWITI